ncbi:DUF6297 family protein [Nocardioides sp. InS609-2]|uniref:DUF6297 family protein n=1 Tax=Nocardioides sp. InS609-2 TaxID=2760705 RepID=UPI0020BF2D1E|nr:DUF6297 family protein [Nocardioides sp. InS609-2]
MATQTGPGIGDLRADIRDWRRGRATASMSDVLQDVYVAVFAALMLGAMLVNVVVGFRREADDLCVAAGCVSARALLPWLTITATLAAVLAMARLLGPVFTTPAAGAWLLSTPVDRASLLRRRFVGLSVVAATIVLAVAVAATALAGLPLRVVTASCAAVAVAGVGVVAVAAMSQKRGRAESRWLLWLLLAVTWAGLLTLALDESPSWRGGPTVGAASAVLALVAAAVVPLVVTGWRGLARLRRRQLEPGGNLSSGLSGALATLDLALAYDVVVAHTARIRGTVRSHRGGPRGPLALVWRDLIRLRRRPMPLLVVAAVVVAPYAVAQAGGGRLTVLVATLVGFVGAVPLCLALRVVTRTPALARMMPFTNAVSRGCTLVVPGVVLVAFGLACSPGLGSAMGVDGGVATQLGLAVGAGALTSTTWWMAARPVNYSVPAVSTPLGALPPGMISGALRGPDMVLVTSAPMLISPTATGAAVTCWLCAAVLAYLVLRR